MRSRFTWSAVPLAVAALVLTGCMRTTGGQAQPGSPGTGLGGAKASTSTLSGVPSPTGSPKTSAGTPVSQYPSTDGVTATIATMTVKLPPGTQYAVESRDPGYAGCLQSASYACEGRILDLREAASSGMINLPDAHRQYGWYTGTDVPTCIGPASDPGVASEATGSTLVESGFAPVGPKKAEYAKFHQTCKEPTENNQIRMWWLPQSKILIVEHASSPELDKAFDDMLASATFAG